MERWGITPYISACYAAPFIMANISSDPANPAAEAWWTHKVGEIKALMPTFGGFVVKADSEGNQGPQAFNQTEADGANLLARALKTVGGIVMWRAFVYGGDTKIGNEDRAREAYDTFLPLDGKFLDNVIVQVKNVRTRRRTTCDLILQPLGSKLVVRCDRRARWISKSENLCRLSSRAGSRRQTSSWRCRRRRSTRGSRSTRCR